MISDEDLGGAKWEAALADMAPRTMTLLRAPTTRRWAMSPEEKLRTLRVAVLCRPRLSRRLGHPGGSGRRSGGLGRFGSAGRHRARRRPARDRARLLLEDGVAMNAGADA